MPVRERGGSETTKREVRRMVPRDRAPLLAKGRNHEIALKLLPKAAAKRLRSGAAVVPRRISWTAPVVRIGKQGRVVLQCGRVRVGPERDPRVTADHVRARGLFATKGDRNHVDANLDRVLSMRAPFHPAQYHQRVLLAVSGAPASRSLPVVDIPTMRMSSGQPEARRDVHERCPDGLHEFASGQGPGTTALAATIYVAAAARAEGHRVRLTVTGEVDRFLRTGSFPGRLVLKRAGIYVTWTGLTEDRPLPWELNHRRVAGLRHARRLRSALRRYVTHLLTARETCEPCPPLPCLDPLVPQLEGLRETLACGAGLDWLRRDEAKLDGINSDHQVQALASLPSFAPFARRGGFWLMEQGYRARRGIDTEVRPIVVRGREDACVRLLRARWPLARFLKPVLVDCAWRGPTEDGLYVPDADAGERNVRVLATLRDETLVCVDHTMVHYGSVLDLDTLVRQRGCSLNAVLPGSFLHPEITREILDDLRSFGVDARRMARAQDLLIAGRPRPPLLSSSYGPRRPVQPVVVARLRIPVSHRLASPTKTPAAANVATPSFLSVQDMRREKVVTAVRLAAVTKPAGHERESDCRTRGLVLRDAFRLAAKRYAAAGELR